jgi:hypothetical protein
MVEADAVGSGDRVQGVAGLDDARRTARLAGVGGAAASYRWLPVGAGQASPGEAALA